MISIEEKNFAEKELIELNTKCEFINKNRKNAIHDINQQIRDIFAKYLIEDAVILNNDISSYLEDEKLNFSLKIGFLDPNHENYNVFGADFDLYFKDNQISINQGTIGQYNRVKNPFQIKRIFVIANIWKNIDALEGALKAIDIEDYKKILNDYYITKDAIRTCDNIITKFREEELIASIKVGSKYKYFQCSYDLKDQYIGDKNNKITVVITSVTENNITYKQIYSDKVSNNYRVSKAKFINFLNIGNLVI